MTVDTPELAVLAVLLLGAALVIAFVLVAISIRSEDNRRRLDGTHPSHAERMTRRLLGAHTRRDSSPPAPARKGGECR